MTHCLRLSVAGVLLVLGPGAAFAQDRAPTTVSPRAAVDELLQADRGFSAASAATDPIAGMASMFADDVVMPIPGSRFLEGKTQVVEALHGHPDNLTARAEWTPVRGGVSADGQHGFTLGFLTLSQPDGARRLLKYISYWVKQPDGWRVVAYKQARRPAGDVSLDAMPPALPARLVPPSSDPAEIARFRDSLDQAERAFSAEAQRIGLGAAFVKYGSADAINVGGGSNASFVVGADNIARLVAAGQPATGGSTLSWAPDRVIVASSGDLGVTIGVIHPNAPDADGTQGFPFFTIWRRASPSDPWRYVAE